MFALFNQLVIIYKSLLSLKMTNHKSSKTNRKRTEIGGKKLFFLHQKLL